MVQSSEVGIGSIECLPPNISSGTAAEEADPPMQKFLDKWFLPVVFVLIGGVIVWALVRR